MIGAIIYMEQIRIFVSLPLEYFEVWSILFRKVSIFVALFSSSENFIAIRMGIIILKKVL
jgi:hypothetical protein